MKEVAYPDVLHRELLERWADGIPVFSENNPHAPEWRATPVLPVDLSVEG